MCQFPFSWFPELKDPSIAGNAENPKEKMALEDQGMLMHLLLKVYKFLM